MSFFLCDTCYGTGEYEEADIDNPRRTVSMECHICDGTGKLKPGTPQYEQTAERFFAECIDLKHQILRQMGQKAN